MNCIRRFSHWLTYDDGWMMIVVIGILVAIVIVIPLGLWYSETDSTQRPVFESWKKLNPTSDISFEDWNRLRRNHLLPGQSSENTTVVVHTSP